MMRITASRLGAIFLGSAACLPALPGLAQDAGETGLILDPIIIQFDRRDEPLKDQPRAVTVIQGDELPPGQVDKGQAIADQTPGLVFSGFNQPGQDFLNLRGMGPLGLPVSSTDHVVGYSTDEVPTSTFGFPPVLFDMDQIEIARGPQGTLFGRNALAGGLNFVPNGADGQPVRNVAASVGTDGFRTLDLVGDGWLVEDRLAARLALHYANYDGTIPNTNIGGEIGSSDEAGGRLSLSAFTDTGWTFSAMAQLDRRETNNSFLLYYEQPNFPESGENAIGSNSRDNRQSIIRVERDFENFRFTSLTGWQDQTLNSESGGADIYLFSAFTGLPEFFFKETDPAFFPSFDEDERIISQEFRLASPEGARASWVVGANYMTSDYDGLRVANDRLDPAGNGTTDVEIDTLTWSLFADGTLPVGERLRLSAGVRHGYEKQTFDGLYVSNGFPGTVPFFSQSDEISDSYTTGRLGLSYDITEALAGYASLSRGYAAGGFEKLFIGSNAGTFSTPFEAATNDSFEVGLKYQTPDNRIGVTLSAYLNRVKNGQLFDFAFTGPTTLAYFFVNQDYDTRGVELEGHVELMPDLLLRGAVSALDTEFVNTPPGSSTGVQDGNEVPLAANLSAFLGIDYRLRGARVGLPGDVLMGADWSYVGERQADAANRWQLPAYHLVNVRLGWAVGGGSVYIFANNLFDERPVYTGAEYAPDVHAVAVGPGRIVGIGGEFTF